MYIAFILSICIYLFIFLSHNKVRKKWRITILVTLGLIIWNIYFLATNFKIIPFYDSYSEYIFIQIVKNDGHFDLNLPSFPYPSPENPGTYPLFSILTIFLELIIQIDIVKLVSILSSVKGLLLILFFYLFAGILAKGQKLYSLITSVSILLLIANPDAGYTTMHFYHRHYSLVLCFIFLYLLLRYMSYNDSGEIRKLLLLFAVIIPLTYIYYPVIYIISTFSLSFILIVFPQKYNLQTHRKLKLILIVSLIMILITEVWNFVTTFPNPFTRNLKWYLDNIILNPRVKSLEIDRYQYKAGPVIPTILRPYPYVYLLTLRDILLWFPLVLITFMYLFKFVKRKKIKHQEYLYLASIFSFVPIVIVGFLGTGWRSLEWRYYMMPMIIYSGSLMYSKLLFKNKYFTKIIWFLILSLFITISFLAPFSHIYFPIYLYSSKLDFVNIGHPNPNYFTIRPFVNNYLKEGFSILSDHIYLLFLTFDINYYNYIYEERVFSKYGEQNTLFIEFINFNIPIGYSTKKQVELLNNIRLNINIDYNRVLDSKPYTIYAK